MAQPSVAREPSMEEILASIRRIIESNDPAIGPDVARSLAPAYAGDHESAEIDEDGMDDARDLSFVLEAANDKAPLSSAPEARATAPIAAPAPAAAAPAAPAQAAPRTISLADLAARVRAAADRSEGSRVDPVMTRPAAPAEERPSPAAAPRMADLRDAVVAAERAPVAPAASPAVRPHMQPMQAAVVVTPEEHVRPTDYQSMGAEMQAALDTMARNHPAILSEPAAAAPAIDEGRGLLSSMAGQQIARSFDELAAVIDGVQRRSLDEMAEEMLRPMLQEWLDDNLPSLVERLVREEIERVARGPRR